MQAIVAFFSKSIPILRKKSRLAAFVGVQLFIGLGAANALGPDVQLPEAKRCKLEELKSHLQAPFHLRVDTPLIACVHNILDNNRGFEWLCTHFGKGGVTKLRTFITVTGKDINPTAIEIDLEKGVLYYQPLGAAGSDLMESRDWAGEDVEDAANVLNYAKSYLLVAAWTRGQYLTGQLNWNNAVARCKAIEQIPITIPEIKWSLRGALFSPRSEPETKLRVLKRNEPDLARYAQIVLLECSASRTVAGRITDIADSGEIEIKSLTGKFIDYKAFNPTLDVDRQPVDLVSLAAISDKSDKGVLVDARYVEEDGNRVLLNCQLRNVTARLVDEMACWDGTYASAISIAKAVEAKTGKPAAKTSVWTTTRGTSRTIKHSLGLRW